MSASEMARVILENIKSLKPKKNRVLIAIAGLPLFDRSADKVIKDAQTISREQDYLVIEGNYLLLDREFWRDLSKYWDYKIFLTVEHAVLKARLIKRWLAENHTYSEAEARVANNDLINANLVNSYKIEPTLELQTV